jgi:hypothetical protein
MKRLTKKQAEKRYNAGLPVILCASKVSPYSIFASSILKTEDNEFEKVVNSFRYYNCQLSETGLGVHYHSND